MNFEEAKIRIAALSTALHNHNYAYYTLSNPVISDQIIDQAGIPMVIDFRDVYASILKDWFQVPEEDIQKMFSHQIKYH